MGKYKYLFWFVETSRLFIIAKIWKTRISIKCIIMALMLIMACCMFIVLHVDTSPNISMLPWLSHAHERLLKNSWKEPIVNTLRSAR
jgi:hypothetical protein